MSANTGPSPTSQRFDFITVGRQSIPIVQTGSNGIAVLSVTPNDGIGFSRQFTFQFSDTFGYTDIHAVDLDFSDFYAECLITAIPSGNLLQLGNASISLNTQGASVSNSFCTVSASGSSITGSGNQLTVTVQVTFSPSFWGTKSVVAFASPAGPGASVARVGTWTVPVLPSALSIAKTHQGSFFQGQTNATYTVTVSNAASAAPTTASVVVTESVPAGLTLVSMTGNGWTCPGTAANDCAQ